MRELDSERFVVRAVRIVFFNVCEVTSAENEVATHTTPQQTHTGQMDGWPLEVSPQGDEICRPHIAKIGWALISFYIYGTFPQS